MSFPDTLPELSEDEREAMNAALIRRLARLLGWSRHA
jgi:hypothetical protein